MIAFIRDMKAILFHAAGGALGLTGAQVLPLTDHQRALVTFFVAAYVFGAMLLHMAERTNAGQKVEADVAAATGIPLATIQAAIDGMPKATDFSDMLAALKTAADAFQAATVPATPNAPDAPQPAPQPGPSAPA